MIGCRRIVTLKMLAQACHLRRANCAAQESLSFIFSGITCVSDESRLANLARSARALVAAAHGCARAAALPARQGAGRGAVDHAWRPADQRSDPPRRILGAHLS